jgi:hypothetical protein
MQRRRSEKDYRMYRGATVVWLFQKQAANIMAQAALSAFTEMFHE